MKSGGGFNEKRNTFYMIKSHFIIFKYSNCNDGYTFRYFMFINIIFRLINCFVYYFMRIRFYTGS